MADGLYFKLARGNLVRNREFYLPYCVAYAVMSAVFFIVLDIIFSQSITNMSYGQTTIFMLAFGAVIMTIFTFGYMLYINSFLMKRRKKEFGLYGILGLEKRHVSRVIFIENLIMNAASLAFGLLCGTVFGKLIFMALAALTSTAVGSTFQLSPAAYILTSVIFAGIFAVTTLRNQLQVRLASPIDLLHGEQKGEKRLRGAIPLTVVGVLFMGVAYGFAYTVKDSAMAITFFWPAVMLVIAGTWALFTAGSQFVLSAMKKNKALYYKPRNFVTISGLLHRMKQNAAGLANICILSTMVLVTVSGCCSLFFGQDSILKVQNPDDYRIDIAYDPEEGRADPTPAADAVRELALRHDIKLDEMYSYSHFGGSVIYSDGNIIVRDAHGSYLFDSSLAEGSVISLGSQFITLADYRAVTGGDTSLAENEVLVLYPGEVKNTSFDYEGTSFKVKDVVHDSPFTKGKNADQTVRLFFVSANEASRDKLISAIAPTSEGSEENKQAHLTFVLNFTGEAAERTAFAVELEDAIYQAVRGPLGAAAYYSRTSMDIGRSEGYSIYGGLLFLGIIFSVLFLTCTVLIIYFKQVSEGYDDRERFAILQKVGMSHEEVRSTIDCQILIVFFMPLIAALLHILAATNLMAVGLEIFAMADHGIVLLCVAATSAVFILLYILVFRITAMTYYRIVKW